MNDEPTRYLIAYDIVDGKRRSKVSDYLLSYGFRVQASVFFVTARGAAFTRMKSRIKKLVNLREDSVIICELGTKSNWNKHYERLGKTVDPSSFEQCVY